MKSCENCNHYQYPEGCFSIEDCKNKDQWQSDYPTLEQENVELKQQLEKLQNEKSAFELLYHTTERHYAEDTVKSQKRIMELEQSLERELKARGKIVSILTGRIDSYEKQYFDVRAERVKDDRSLERACECIAEAADAEGDCNICPVDYKHCPFGAGELNCLEALKKHFKEATQ